MSLNAAKCARFLKRVLILIPTSHEKYDASHVSIVYFCVLGLSLLGESLEKKVIEKYLAELWVGNGYKASISYLSTSSEAHLTSTYFCLAIRKMLGLAPLSEQAATAIMEFVANCHLKNGNFKATASGISEPSLRHTYSAHAIMKILGAAHPSWLETSCKYILSCQNYEGGFGDSPLDESHGGLTYCALASLSIAGSLDKVHPRIANYLGKRQLYDGGYNGRPNKPADVCYSFWVIASIKLMGIDMATNSENDAVEFILGPAADELLGGFSKAPGAEADPYHTSLALCSLSMLSYPCLAPLDPVLTCPKGP